MASDSVVQVIILYYENGCSIVRALRPFYGLHRHPSQSTIQLFVTKFESTAMINQPTPVRKRNEMVWIVRRCHHR